MEKDVVVTIEDGINADVVSLLVQTACRFESRVYLQEGERKVNMKSIMGMTILHLKKGTTFKLVAEGNDESKAIEDIAGCFE